MRILWVEDRPQQIKYHVQLLRAKGHDVTVCGTGEDTLKAIIEPSDVNETYDVILLDIMLPIGEGQAIDATTRPELMGQEILHQMREAGIIIPVIGVSAIADEQLRRSLQEDFDFVLEVLKKPVTMDDLRESISRIFKPAETDAEVMS